MTNIIKIALITVSVSALTNCGSIKRKYKSEYRSETNSTKKNTVQKLNFEKREIINESNSELAYLQTNNKQQSVLQNSIFYDEIDNAGQLGDTTIKNPTITTPQTKQECDIIILKNGDEIKAIIQEVGLETIKYLNYDNLNGPLYTIKNSEVFMLKYPNGTKDVFNASAPVVSTPNSAPQTNNFYRKTEGLGVAGMVISIIGLFFLGIPLGLLGIIFGGVSLGKISKYPEKYKGQGFGITAIIVGIVALVGALVLLAMRANN